MTDIADRLRAGLADRYRIERELGSGGMATVYLAEDLRHGRQVAIKLLHPELSAVLGPERFLAEIRTTAGLQHPHILPLFDSGSADGLLFYVMPRIQGETLRTRLEREHQLSIEDAVRLATEVADALEYAHRQGIVHRDVKPENILIQGGHALVADFGIALAVQQAGGGRLTQTGLSLGTPQYMAPEQAMGEKHIDARADVYALGVVTYEMLAGEPPFTGPTAQAVVAKLITDRPRPLAELRESVPAPVAAAVHKALAKLAADRFHSAAAFAHALGERTSSVATLPVPVPAGRSLPARVANLARRPALPWAVALLLAAATTMLLVRGAPAPLPTLPIRASVALPPGIRIAPEPYVVLSPDGSRLAVSGFGASRTQVFVRRLDAEEFVPVSGTEDSRYPFFSPDGEWIAFNAGNQLKKVPVGGGPAIPLVEASWGGGSWGHDGTIVYTKSYNSGLWRVSAGGGKPDSLTAPEREAGELAHFWPQILPDGRHVLFTNFSTPTERAKIEILDLATGRREVLVTGGVYGRYVPAGYLVYARGEDLLAAPFDAGRLRMTGPAVPVLGRVAMTPSAGLSSFAVSSNGTLAYGPASALAAETQLVWVDRQGTETSAVPRGGRYSAAALSPDGRRLAVVMDASTENSDIWTYEPGRDVLTRVTLNPAADFNPLWTRDGRRLIYASERPVFDLYWRSADASAGEEALLTSELDKYPGSLSPDGKVLAFSVATGATRELWVLPLEGGGKPRPYLQNGFLLRHPALSPNGRWLAYDSDESGSRQVYLQSYPDPTIARRQVSTGGGTEPRWTRGGRELVYRRGDSTLAVGIDPSSGEAGRASVLFAGPYLSQTWGRTAYDVAPDGSRFLMVKTPEGATERIDLVLNWFEELRRKLD